MIIKFQLLHSLKNKDMKKIFFGLYMMLATLTNAQNWELIWQDEFSGSGLPDATKWGYDVGNWGWGNYELQNYTDSRVENARQENGNLIVEARRDWYNGIEYSSARMVSKYKGDWTYGRIEVRAKVPLGKGLWPAIWMLPTDNDYGIWPRSGEIDIMENFALGGIKPYHIEGNVHTETYNHLKGTNKGGKSQDISNVEDNYHVYAVNWYEDKIDFEVDGTVYFTFVNEGNWEAWPFDKRFHLILNLAVGGALGTTPDPNIFPKRMTVDYVRVYKQSSGPISTTGLVTVYKDCPFGGFSAGLELGDYNLAKLQSLGIDQNQISSINIAEGYKVVGYEGTDFTGNQITYTSSQSCTGDWNDKINSIKVLPNGETDLEGTYYVKNRVSDLYMDVAGGEVATANSTNIHQWFKTDTKNQQFNFVHLGNGAYQIIAAHSNKAIDVAGISKNNGANVFQYEYLGSKNQQFIIVPTGDGYYKLIASHSGKVVEVVDARTDNGANVQQYDNNNQQCSHWVLEPMLITNTNEVNSNSKIIIFPNPINDFFRILNGEDLIGKTMVIYSADGKIISTKIYDGDQIDVKELSPGIYILRILDNRLRFIKFK